MLNVRRGVVVITIVQFHSTKPESAQIQIMLAACLILTLLRISNNGFGRKESLKVHSQVCDNF